jgi:2-polyprenyl-6-hydroxyphenyl methylase/3-demethylubiquinone-9 3-methyltransferase
MTAEREMAAGARFEFGKNWSRFLELLDDRRIADAEASLREKLGIQDLNGLRFLDIGCGSGLFSLAARRLGAAVYSFDFDPQSVACARELKRRYFRDDTHWQVGPGSVLDPAYMRQLGRFDVVYSWGVLHHTGALWFALEQAIARVTPEGGRLFIAIYADQGWKSHAWWFVKLFYNRLPRFLRPFYLFVVSAVVRILVILKYTILLRPMTAIAPLFGDRRARGMSARHDRVDWIGGFPYEFATLETLTSYLEARGFSMMTTQRAGSLGCHELVARRLPCAE